MAFPSVLLMTLLFVIATPLAHGLIINGNPIAQVNITGLLQCNLTGVLQPISGKPVELQCGSTNTTVGQAVSRETGSYTIIINTPTTFPYDLTSCFVAVKLPFIGCDLYPPTGLLMAPITIFNVIRSVAGFIANFLTGGFTVIQQ